MSGSEAGTIERKADAGDATPIRKLKQRLRQLYFGPEHPERTMRLAFFAFDLAAIIFFVTTTVLNVREGLLWIDVAIGVVYLGDFLARLLISRDRVRFLLKFSTLTDVVVLISLLGSAFVVDLAFLRILRTLRVLRSYHLIDELAREWPQLKQREELIQSAVNLFAFVFIVTSIVFLIEEHHNPQIGNWFDALYFTVATLTTTGFGDIVVTDTAGRMLTVLIMLLGVALFLRLVQTIFRPNKVRYTCRACGLARHDPDAVHCKHCGAVVRIATEGES